LRAKVSYRFFSNWRQLIYFDKIEVCSTIATAESSRIFSKIVVFLSHATNGLVHKCPYIIGPAKIYNYSDTIGKAAELKKGIQVLPNGDYRIDLLAWDEEDPGIFGMNLFFTIKDWNADTF